MRFAGLLLGMVSCLFPISACACVLAASRCLFVKTKADSGCVVVWYFFNDVYPPLHNGHRPLDPPVWWTRLFEDRTQQEGEEQLDDTGAAPVESDIAAAAAPDLR